MSTATVPLGTLLRDWRRRRRLSQLDLALEAGVSARHLSFLETGRSKPSREMVLHLSEQLEVPLRDRNHLLLAAGFAPAFEERAIDAPEMAPVREALERVLAGHEPYPAVVVDRWWNLAAANRSIAMFTDTVPDAPDGAAGQRAAREPAPGRDGVADPQLRRVARAPGRPAGPAGGAHRRRAARGAPRRGQRLPGRDRGGARPRRRDRRAAALRRRRAELAFFSTIATFGTAVDITLAELSIEAFFPADESTAAYLLGN